MNTNTPGFKVAQKMQTKKFPQSYLPNCLLPKAQLPRLRSAVRSYFKIFSFKHLDVQKTEH